MQQAPFAVHSPPGLIAAHACWQHARVAQAVDMPAPPAPEFSKQNMPPGLPGHWACFNPFWVAQVHCVHAVM